MAARRSWRSGPRLLMLFAVLAAVFAMHTAEAGHDSNAGPTMFTMAAAQPVAGAAAPDRITTSSPGQPVDHSGPDHCPTVGACLGFLAAAFGFAALVAAPRGDQLRVAAENPAWACPWPVRRISASAPTPGIRALGVSRT